MKLQYLGFLPALFLLVSMLSNEDGKILLFSLIFVIITILGVLWGIGML